MQRRMGLALVGLLSVTTNQALAQQDFTTVTITATPVKGNIYMLAADTPAGNIGVSVGADGVLIVDDQFAPLVDKIRAALKDLDGGSLKFILNTHWHGDHTGGNKVFGSEASIIAHTNGNCSKSPGKIGKNRKATSYFSISYRWVTVGFPGVIE